MTKPKVTIIIPVYNAEKYLYSCLESATQQSLKDIEIICIDDNSTDHSPDILSKIADNDTRITVIRHDKNEGEGASRNTGLDNARGDYVFHLDADDTAPPDALEKLYSEALRYNCDMVKGRYDIIHETGDTELLDWSTPDEKVINTNIYTSRLLQRIPTSHCTYLYKLEFLNRHKIRYRTDLVIGLDLIALATALVNASTVTLIPDTVYHYFQSDNSAIRSKLTSEISIDALRTKEIIAELLNEKGLHEAAFAFLQAWSYIIETHWLRMPSYLTMEESCQSFTRFRTIVSKYDITPWGAGTPDHHRYILALVLSGRDKEALAFLGTDDASNGFSSKDKLTDSLNFILETAPNDTGSLITLGHIAMKDGDLEHALDYFYKATKHSEGNIGANIQIATILKEFGQFEKARSNLDIALNSLINGHDLGDHVRQIISAKEDILRREDELELNSVRTELKNTHDELNSAKTELLNAHSVLNRVRAELNLVYSSTSWKVTKPLRRIMTYLK